MSLFIQEAVPATDLAITTETDNVAKEVFASTCPIGRHGSTFTMTSSPLFLPQSPGGQTGESPRRFETARPLEGGIYVVEASLAGQTRRLEVPVTPGVVTTVGPSHWESLTVLSASPLVGSEFANPAHAAAAEEWSRKTTLLDVKGDSRLFLFGADRAA